MSDPIREAYDARRLLMQRLNAILDDRWPLAGKIMAAVDEYAEACSTPAEAPPERPSIEDEWYEQDSGGGDDPAKGADETPAQVVTSLSRPSQPSTPAEALDPHRLGGLIERAIRESRRKNGLIPDGWTLVEMALAYSPETPTEPSLSSHNREADHE